MNNRPRTLALLVAALLSILVVAGGCGDDEDEGTSTTGSTTAQSTPENSQPAPQVAVGEGAGEPLAQLGEGEGEVNLIAWAGYVEDGSTDPAVDWVSDFEKETG